MSNRIFVGDLPVETSVDVLRHAFEQAGHVVEASLATDRHTQTPRSFGFVVMSNDAEATRAVQRLDRSVLGGSRIRVRWARGPLRRAS